MFYNGYYHPSPEPSLFYKVETLYLLSTGPGWPWFPTVLVSLMSLLELCGGGVRVCDQLTVLSTMTSSWSAYQNFLLPKTLSCPAMWVKPVLPIHPSVTLVAPVRSAAVGMACQYLSIFLVSSRVFLGVNFCTSGHCSCFRNLSTVLYSGWATLHPSFRVVQFLYTPANTEPRLSDSDHYKRRVAFCFR